MSIFAKIRSAFTPSWHKDIEEVNRKLDELAITQSDALNRVLRNMIETRDDSQDIAAYLDKNLGKVAKITPLPDGRYRMSYPDAKGDEK